MEKYASTTNTDTGKVALVFTGPYCGQCKLIKPSLEKFASEDTSGTKFYEVNTDSQEGIALARKYKVSALPSVVILEDAATKACLVGPANVTTTNLKNNL